jgi:SHAQKYF class myb-like DNA-binding protein
MPPPDPGDAGPEAVGAPPAPPPPPRAPPKAREKWTDDEHARFVTAFNSVGRNWRVVQAAIGTRSLAQVRGDGGEPAKGHSGVVRGAGALR